MTPLNFALMWLSVRSVNTTEYLRETGASGVVRKVLYTFPAVWQVFVTLPAVFMAFSIVCGR